MIPAIAPVDPYKADTVPALAGENPKSRALLDAKLPLLELPWPLTNQLTDSKLFDGVP